MFSQVSLGFGLALDKFSIGDFLAQAHWFDWILLFFIFLGVIYGASKGLWRECVKLIWILGLVFIVAELYPKVATYLTTETKMKSDYATPAGFMIVLCLAFLAVVFVDSYLLKLMHTTVIAPLKILGGIFFGFFNTLLIIGLIVQGVFLWPFYPIKKFFQEGNTYIAYRTVEIVPKVHDWMLAPLERWQSGAKKKISVPSDI